jgi:hypothetical protein
MEGIGSFGLAWDGIRPFVQATYEVQRKAAAWKLGSSPERPISTTGQDEISLSEWSEFGCELTWHSGVWSYLKDVTIRPDPEVVCRLVRNLTTVLAGILIFCSSVACLG